MKKALAALVLVLSPLTAFAAGTVSAPTLVDGASSAIVPQAVKDYVKAIETNDADLLWNARSPERQEFYNERASFYGYEPKVDAQGNTISAGLQLTRETMVSIARMGRTATHQYLAQMSRDGETSYLYIITFVLDGAVEQFPYTFFVDSAGKVAKVE